MAEANLSGTNEEPFDRLFYHIDADNILHDIPNVLPHYIPCDIPHSIPNDMKNDMTNDGLNHNADEYVPDRRPVLSQPDLNISHLSNASKQILSVKHTSSPVQGTEGELSEVVKTLTLQIMLSRLTPLELSVFTNDALKREFQTLIEHRLVPSSEKVHY